MTSFARIVSGRRSKFVVLGVWLAALVALGPSYPLFAFIFVVALGIDYNIFLMWWPSALGRR